MSSTITSPLAKDLLDLPGVHQGFAPVSANEGRYVFVGRPGCGKSTILHSNPRAFILDPEGGGKTVDDPQAGVYVVPKSVPPGEQAAAYKKMAERIIERKRSGKTDIQMLGIDTIDKFIDIFLRDFCLNHHIDDPLDYKDGNGNAYTIVRKEIFGILDSAYRAGLGWTMLAHVTPKTKQVGGETKIIQSLAVSDSFAIAVRRECEHMLFMEFASRTWTESGVKKTVRGKTIEIPGKTKKEVIRVLRTIPGGVWKGETTNDVKVRVPFPDKTVVPRKGGWASLSQAYEAAVQELTGEKR